MQAVNLTDNNGHVALLQVSRRVVNPEIVDVGAARHINDDDILLQDGRAEGYAAGKSAKSAFLMTYMDVLTELSALMARV